MILTLIISAIVFGCATYLANELAQWLATRDGRSLKASAETLSLLRVLLPVATAVVGALLNSYAADGFTFAIVGVVCAALSMATMSEICYGHVPDLILIVPLVIVAGAAIFQHQWGQIGAMILLAVPFAVLSIVSRRDGVARTDIELAALGGAMLGFKYGVIAFFIALVVAFAMNFSKRAEKKPIELTPYLSTSIVVALLVRLVLPVDIV